MSIDPRYRLGAVLEIVNFKVDNKFGKGLYGLDEVALLANRMGEKWRFRNINIRSAVFIDHIPSKTNDDTGEFLLQDLEDDTQYCIDYDDVGNSGDYVNVVVDKDDVDDRTDELFYDFQEYLSMMIYDLQLDYLYQKKDSIRAITQLMLLLVTHYERKFKRTLYVTSPDRITNDFAKTKHANSNIEQTDDRTIVKIMSVNNDVSVASGYWPIRSWITSRTSDIENIFLSPDYSV